MIFNSPINNSTAVVHCTISILKNKFIFKINATNCFCKNKKLTLDGLR